LTYLLDTNVISDWASGSPDPDVRKWLGFIPSHDLFLSAVSIAEVRFGVESRDPGRRRTELETWISDQLIPYFDERLLPVDGPVASCWGRVLARAKRAGRPIDIMDGFIAATAEAHDLILVTRNVDDFKGWGGRVFNPWDEDPPA
jgi:hypothetical protein